ncbi:hypothetical protein V1477_012401, partial [Vespula maculifrons]
IKWSGGGTLPLVKRYKAVDFSNGPVLPRISTSPHLNPRSTHAPECSGGDTLPLVKRYKAADFGNGPVLPRISTSPHLNPRSTHAPKNRVVWWGYFGTREVIKGDGL